MTDSKNSLIWFSRALRWALGLFFIWIGFHYEDAWPVMIFGLAFFATGFLRPRRCIEDNCSLDENNSPSPAPGADLHFDEVR